MIKTIKANPVIAGLLIPAILSGFGYVGKLGVDVVKTAWGNHYKAGVHEGVITTKNERDEEYNTAIRDAIVYRAKYDVCCSRHGADRPE